MQSYFEMTSLGFIVSSSCLVTLLAISAVDTTTLFFEVSANEWLVKFFLLLYFDMFRQASESIKLCKQGLDT